MSVSFISPNTRAGALLCLLLAVVLVGVNSCGRSASKADAKGGARGEEGAEKGGAANAPEAPPVAVTTAKAEAREVPSYINRRAASSPKRLPTWPRKHRVRSWRRRSASARSSGRAT
jgi:hypothetical protein